MNSHPSTSARSEDTVGGVSTDVLTAPAETTEERHDELFCPEDWTSAVARLTASD